MHTQLYGFSQLKLFGVLTINVDAVRKNRHFFAYKTNQLCHKLNMHVKSNTSFFYLRFASLQTHFSI